MTRHEKGVHMSRKKVSVLLGSGAAIAGIAFVASSASSQPGKEDAAIIEAARLAMVAHQQLGAVDALSTDPDANVKAAIAKGRYTKSARPELRQLSNGRISAAQDASKRRLERYFTGAELTFELTLNDRQPARYVALTLPDGAPGSPAVDTTVTADYITTGGANDFHVDTLTTDSTGVTLTGTATIWINGVMIEGDLTEVADPSNKVDFTLHLVKVGDDWKVDSYEAPFAGGSGP